MARSPPAKSSNLVQTPDDGDDDDDDGDGDGDDDDDDAVDVMRCVGENWPIILTGVR